MRFVSKRTPDTPAEGKPFRRLTARPHRSVSFLTRVRAGARPEVLVIFRFFWACVGKNLGTATALGRVPDRERGLEREGEREREKERER